MTIRLDKYSQNVSGISFGPLCDRLSASKLGVEDALEPAEDRLEIDTPLLLLAEKIGAKKATRAWIRSATAVNALVSRVRALDIRCDLKRRSSIYLAGNVLGSRGLQCEVELRQRIGLPSLYLHRRELERRLGVDRSGAILWAGAAEADPVRLAAGFLRHALRRGARLFAPVEVEHVDCGRRSDPSSLEGKMASSTTRMSGMR